LEYGTVAVHCFWRLASDGNIDVWQMTEIILGEYIIATGLEEFHPPPC
jgi:hypothetical protein